MDFFLHGYFMTNFYLHIYKKTSENGQKWLESDLVIGLNVLFVFCIGINGYIVAGSFNNNTVCLH